MVFGSRLKGLRKKRGISQQKLATESPAGYIYGAIKNGYYPAKKAQAWAETVLSCGRCLLDDSREGEWAEAFKRLGQAGLSPDRARQFRENYVKDVDDIVRSLE